MNGSKCILWTGRRDANGYPRVYLDGDDRGAHRDAIRRRETFGTSGVRIRPRFFAGWSLLGVGLYIHALRTYGRAYSDQHMMADL